MTVLKRYVRDVGCGWALSVIALLKLFVWESCCWCSLPLMVVLKRYVVAIGFFCIGVIEFKSKLD